LQRQDKCLGYPGKFPERASRTRHYPIKKQTASLGVRFCCYHGVLFSKAIHHHLQKTLAGGNITLDGVMISVSLLLTMSRLRNENWKMLLPAT